jgi:hypothetical protein
MKKIHVTFTSIVEVDQVFTVTDEVAEQISKRDLQSSSFDQEEQFELYEFILENNMECKTIDATDLSEDGEEFCLNQLTIE